MVSLKVMLAATSALMLAVPYVALAQVESPPGAYDAATAQDQRMDARDPRDPSPGNDTREAWPDQQRMPSRAPALEYQTDSVRRNCQNYFDRQRQTERYDRQIDRVAPDRRWRSRSADSGIPGERREHRFYSNSEYQSRVREAGRLQQERNYANEDRDRAQGRLQRQVGTNFERECRRLLNMPEPDAAGHGQGAGSAQ